MQPEFWVDRWRSGQIGFHQPAVDHNLREFWPTLGVTGGARVLVPLCGKTLDLLWLCEQGYLVTGVELSEIALQSLCMENGIASRRRSLPDFDVYQAANLQLFRGDFFTLTPPLVGKVAAIYDRGALISWAPELRAKYVEHLTTFTGPGTHILLITLEYDQMEMSGPPFSVDETEVQRLFASNYAIREIARRDTLPNEPRFRARGVNCLSEVCYHLLHTG